MGKMTVWGMGLPSVMVLEPVLKLELVLVPEPEPATERVLARRNWLKSRRQPAGELLK